MKLYSESEQYKLYNGNMLDMLEVIEKAIMYENKERQAKYKFIGIELTDQYLPIAEARIKDAEMDTFEYNQDNYKQENNKPTKNYLF